MVDFETIEYTILE